MRSVLAFLMFALPAAASSAEEYSFFNPKPDAMLRPLSTDRPDTTESAYTVDAGHMQAELSFFEYTFDRDDGTRTDSYSIMPTNAKIGLTNYMDLQLVFTPYQIDRAREGDSRFRGQGFGDSQIRTKFNLWGNDGGDDAGAIMTFVSLPTGYRGVSTYHVEGGGMFIYQSDLPDDWGMAAMLEFDLARNEDDDGYGVDCLHTATVGHPIAGALDFFVEYAGTSSMGTDRQYLSYFDAGFTYGFTENIQFDAGTRVGLTTAADDLAVFSGVSIRR